MLTRLDFYTSQLEADPTKLAEYMAISFLQGVAYGAGISPGKYRALSEHDLKARAVTEVALYLMEEVDGAS